MKLAAQENKMANQMTHEQKLKVEAEIAKLIAETAKINTETKWYTAIVASTGTLAIVAVVKLFL